MGDVINLNRARKARHRAAKEAQAAENRAKFGRTGEQKAADAAEREEAGRMLDGARREKRKLTGKINGSINEER